MKKKEMKGYVKLTNPGAAITLHTDKGVTTIIVESMVTPEEASIELNDVQVDTLLSYIEMKRRQEDAAADWKWVNSLDSP